jgi:hypothetical protein
MGARPNPCGQPEWKFKSRGSPQLGTKGIAPPGEPHLLSLYVNQGMRTFSKRNENSAEAGYLIPIVSVIEDVESLRWMASARRWPQRHSARATSE